MPPATTRPPGRRELRKAKTRLDILAAAQQLFDDVGYDRARTADIARRAGVSEPTVFRYFPSKADLAMAPFTEWLDRCVETFLGHLETGTPLQAIEAMLESDHPSVQLGPTSRRRFQQMIFHPDLVSQVYEAFDRVVGRLVPILAGHRAVDETDPRAALDARLIVSVLEVAVRTWVTTDGAVAVDTTVRACVDRLRPLLAE